MAEGRLNPMPAATSDPSAAQRAQATMGNSKRESQAGPQAGGSGENPRTPCVADTFTMQQLSSKKVD